MNSLTKDIALSLGYRAELVSKSLKNADGSALRCRVNGKCQTWKTRALDFRLSVKYGFKTCFYITQANAAEWIKM